jgi:tetratricopeptide (TPR) repeat protein
MTENQGNSENPENPENPDNSETTDSSAAAADKSQELDGEQNSDAEQEFFQNAEPEQTEATGEQPSDESSAPEADKPAEDAADTQESAEESVEESPELADQEDGIDIPDGSPSDQEPEIIETEVGPQPDQAVTEEETVDQQSDQDSETETAEPQEQPSQPEPEIPDIQVLSDGVAEDLPVPGGQGSHPAPFDPRQAPIWQSLLAEYEREIAAIGDVPAAAMLYYESGKLWEEKLAQPRNAWNCYNKAFQLQPTMIPNIRAAGRLASQVGNWNVAVQIIDSEIEALDDPSEKAYLHYRRGLILEEKLGKADEARVAYEAAIALVPENIELLKQQERLAISTGDWKTVLDVRLLLIDLIKDPAVCVQIILSCARLYQVQFEDKKNAEQMFRRALEIEPENASALSSLRAYYSETKNNDQLLEIVQLEAQVASDPATAAWLWYQTAHLQREQSGDDEKALESLTRALSLTPTNHMILAEMANIYENLMRWQELVDIYEKMVEVISDRQEKVSLYFKLGSIWEEKLFNEDRAIADYSKVVELSPNYLPALQALGKLFYRKGQWDELVQMYEVEIRETKDSKPKAVKLYKLAEILEERLSRDEDSIQKLEQCLDMSPGYLPALKALGRLYTKYERWESLIHMYEKELEVTQDHDQSVFLLDKIGTLWEEKLNNIDKAIETYQHLLEISPNYLPAIRTLGKLHVRADRWEDMINVNELEAQLINDQKQVVSLLHRNGEIYEEKLNDKDKAIEMYKKVLALAPSYLPALQSLGRLYFIKGRWEDLIAMHRQEIEVTLNEDQQIALLYKIGELFDEKLVQEDKAIVAYQEVLRIQPTNFPALKSLIRIFANKRDWESLIEVYEKESNVLEDPQQRALSLYRVAEIWENHLDQPEKAVETLQSILQTIPDHTPSMRSLIRLYAQAEDWRGLLGVYERQLQNSVLESQTIQIFGAIAEIYTNQLNDLVQAAECHEKVLELKDDHLPSIEALERIYLSQRNYSSLARIYESLFQRTSDPLLKLSLQSQIADLKENRIQPPQNAGENHLKVLSINSTHPEALRSLDILYHKFGTWQGLKNLYERELRRDHTPEEAADLCLRIADLTETRLESPDIATHYYKEALRISPDLLPAIKALKRISLKNDDHESMIGLLDREGQVTRDPRQAIATLLQAAQIYVERFNDPARAIECYFKVLERDPKETQAFSQLEALLIQQADWERLTVLYRNRVAITEDSRALAELHNKLGGLFREQLERPEDAAQSFKEVLKINPSNVQASAVLAELTFETEQWDESIQLCTRLQELTTEPDLLSASQYRMGLIYQEKLPDLEKAVLHFNKVLEIKPGDISTLERLKAIYSARQQWDEAIETLSKLIEVDTDPANQIKHHLEQAGIFESGIDDPEKAVAAYRHVQELEPSNVTIIQKLGELYEKLERWQDLIDSYHSFIRLLPPDREQDAVPLHMKMGGLLHENLNNTDRAILEFKRVTEINPRHIEAHEALAGLYGSTGLYYANAVDEHRKLLDINPFRLDSYHELRRIFEEQRVFDKVLCVCAALHYLRAADQNEEFFYGENRGKIPDRSTNTLTPEEIEKLLIHPDEQGVVRKIMKLVGPHLFKLFAPNLEKHGVGKGDRARPDNPLRTLCNGMVANLGEIEYELYQSSQPTHLVALENTSPPSLIVGDGLIKRTVVKEQRFALGRAIKRISDGSYLATIIGTKELAKLLAAVVTPYHPSSPVATFPSELPPDMPKRVNKALPRKVRKAVEELMNTNATDLARVPDYDVYFRGLELSANRFGLLMCNDLPQAIMHLTREDPELRDKRLNTTEEIVSALSNKINIYDLLRFAVSEEYFRLRTRMKFSIVS